ncbi:putative 3-beta-hydroxysteroid-Delta(8) Delta(7)-isomerase, partial [Bienertia sinuspersici]
MESHPHSPKDLILPDFVPNFLTTTAILGLFTTVSAVVLFISWIFSGTFSKATKVERLLICWFTFSGLVHVIVEGYFVFTPNFYQDKAGDFLAKIWKEYNKVALELVTTVVWGPSCLLA